MSMFSFLPIMQHTIKLLFGFKSLVKCPTKTLKTTNSSTLLSIITEPTSAGVTNNVKKNRFILHGVIDDVRYLANQELPSRRHDG